MVVFVDEEDPGLPGIHLRNGKSVIRGWLSVKRLFGRTRTGFLLQSQKLPMKPMIKTYIWFGHFGGSTVRRN